MRVLVTGGAGYIGSHTAKALALAGYEPVILDDFSSGHRWAVKWGTIAEGSLADCNLLHKVFHEIRVDAVIHFAGVIQVGESMRDPQKYFWSNGVNTLKLLDAMRAAEVKHVVFSSSAAVYGDPEVVPIPEDHPARPVSPYGESKLFVERVLRWYGLAYGVRWMALRYFNACGASPDGDLGESHHPESHLIPLVIAAAMGRRPSVEIYGTDYPTTDGTAIRDYIHVLDLAEAHLRALRRLLDGSESYALNLGTGHGHTVREVIDAVTEISGVTSLPIRHAPRRPGDSPSLVADPSLAQKVLQWTPQHSSLEEIVRSAWQWHKVAASE
ncbi:MAG: UDP-glucose 4-epimerase GalE [Terriglobia bacterium]